MKKLTVLLLALAMLCTCFALAACGDDGDTSSADSSAASTESSASGASSVTSTASSAASSEASSEASSATSSEAAAPTEKPLWLTHYNNGTVEGSGVVYNETDTAGGWWLHVAFKPVDGEDGVYEIAEITNGIADGSAAVVAVPEGGFVYALNTGNNYTSTGGINYTSTSCNNMIADAQTWKVGDKFTFTGIDLEDFTEVPTSTEGTDWYDPSYVCTATYTKVG